MTQAKVTIEEAHLRFLNQHKKYGFKDKSSVIRAALDHLLKELEKEKLKMSADLYAEMYNEDEELGKLTESAISEWPEW
jgi:Arc/MetJ-type ribon-helix-helix transcriptional regulator